MSYIFFGEYKILKPIKYYFSKLNDRTQNNNFYIILSCNSEVFSPTKYRFRKVTSILKLLSDFFIINSFFSMLIGPSPTFSKTPPESADENEFHNSVSEKERNSDPQSDSSEQSFSKNKLNNENQELYEDAPFTLLNSIMTILGMKLVFKLTNVVLDFIIKLILLHCPSKNKCVKSLHCFQAVFKNIKTPMVNHYFCSTCQKIVKETCEKCNDKSKIYYFIEISIIAQLIIMFKRPGFCNKLPHRFKGKKLHATNL